MASKTFIPSVPTSYRHWWLERVYPSILQSLQPPGNSILDPLPTTSTEAQRIHTYGHIWHWWQLSPEARQVFEEMG